jgi:hypothetical protein
VGFGLNLPWATSLWPWPDGKFSYLFVGSILAAASVAFIWIGITGEWGAMAAGTLTTLATTAGISVYTFLLAAGQGRRELVPYAVGAAISAVISLAAFFWSRRYAILDTRAMPPLLRVSYVVFVIALVLAATALILQAPAIFPWPLNPDSSVVFGWIFVGDAFYFLYSLLNPRWHNARAQLLSFLAYDIFLLPPFIGLFGTVAPGHMLSLVVYLAVLVYSALLAIYYLFIDPGTRSWAIVPRQESILVSPDNRRTIQTPTD